MRTSIFSISAIFLSFLVSFGCSSDDLAGNDGETGGQQEEPLPITEVDPCPNESLTDVEGMMTFVKGGGVGNPNPSYITQTGQIVSYTVFSLPTSVRQCIEMGGNVHLAWLGAYNPDQNAKNLWLQLSLIGAPVPDNGTFDSIEIDESIGGFTPLDNTIFFADVTVWAEALTQGAVVWFEKGQGKDDKNATFTQPNPTAVKCCPAASK